MHVLSPEQRLPGKKRSKAEKVFQRVNTIVVAAQLATLIVLIGLVAVAAPKSMKNNLFVNSELQLVNNYYYPDCEKTYTTSNGLFNNYPFTVSVRNIAYLVTRSVYNMKRCWAIYAAYIGIGMINKLLFDLNIHHVTIGYLQLRKDVISIMEIIFLILSFVTTKMLERENEILQDYVSGCYQQTYNKDFDKSYFQYSSPFIAFYVGLAISAALTFFALLVGFVSMWSLEPPQASSAPEDQDDDNDERGERRQEEEAEMEDYDFNNGEGGPTFQPIVATGSQHLEYNNARSRRIG